MFPGWNKALIIAVICLLIGCFASICRAQEVAAASNQRGNTRANYTTRNQNKTTTSKLSRTTTTTTTTTTLKPTLETSNPKITSGANVSSRSLPGESGDSPRRRQGSEYREGDTRVPLWIIAHMINSIDQIEPALDAGSNGIEVDVSFDKRGFPAESYHGFPCDCGRHCHHREDFVKMVRYISGLSHPQGSSNLQLVLFDLKLKGLDERQKEAAGGYLASILHENLYPARHPEHGQRGQDNRHRLGPAPVRVVISINHVVDDVLVKSFLRYLRQNRLDYMRKHVGFDVGMNDNLTDISQMWDSFEGQTGNVWQGDGLTNCGNIVRGIDRLKSAISQRNNQGHFKKIYFWTADVMYQIRSVLRLGLDAILTNQPQRVNQVLEEPEFREKYRPASNYDDPFAQFWIQPSAWQMSVPTIGELGETVSNIRQTSANFVKTIPDGISAVIKKVHSSIASHIR